MSSNVTCLPIQYRSPPPGTYSFYFAVYVFPLVFTFGVIGNILNLIILQKMKLKSNYFLSAMALADIGFFLSMFMLNLSAYDTLATSKNYLRFHYNSKMTFNAMSNWFSSASIWFAVVVTFERLVAIKFPLRARYLWNRHRLMIIVCSIFVFTFSMQFYQWLWLKPTSLPDCNNTNNSIFVFQRIRVSDPFYSLVQTALIVCPFITVVGPLFALIIINVMLIVALRKATKKASVLGTKESEMRKSQRTERKICIMVTIIVSAFFVFNLPSTVVFVCSIFTTIYTSKFVLMITLTANHMVIVHKMLNFPLYCCSSETFRQKSLEILKCNAMNPTQKRSTDYSTIRNNSSRSKAEYNNECDI